MVHRISRGQLLWKVCLYTQGQRTEQENRARKGSLCTQGQRIQQENRAVNPSVACATKGSMTSCATKNPSTVLGCRHAPRKSPCSRQLSHEHRHTANLWAQSPSYIRCTAFPLM